METSEISRREKMSQIISPLLVDGVTWLHFLTPVQVSSVSWKAANEKAAMAMKSSVKNKNALLVVSAFLMAFGLKYKTKVADGMLQVF